MPQRRWVFDHGTMFAACALGVARVALLVEDLHPVFFFGMQMKCDATTSCLFDVFVFLLVCYFPRCWTFLTLRSGRRFSMNSLRADECGERLTVAKGFSTSSENQLGWRNVDSFLRILVCLLMCCCCALFLALCYHHFLSEVKCFGPQLAPRDGTGEVCRFRDAFANLSWHQYPQRGCQDPGIRSLVLSPESAELHSLFFFKRHI